MADFEQALLFIEQHGTRTAKALLDYALHGVTPVGDAHPWADIAIQQHDDGGFAGPCSKGPSSLDATCHQLQQLFYLGADSQRPVVRRALTFLLNRQGPDGSWSAAVAGDDPCAVPETLQTEPLASPLYLTAVCTQQLANFAVHVDAIQVAVAFLARRIRRVEWMTPTLPTHWLTATTLHRSGWQAEAEAMLAATLPACDGMDAVALTWMLNSLIDAGVAADHPLLVAGAEKLSRLQRADGHWDSTEPSPAHATALALRALIRLEQFEGHPFFN